MPVVHVAVVDAYGLALISDRLAEANVLASIRPTGATRWSSARVIAPDRLGASVARVEGVAVVVAATQDAALAASAEVPDPIRIVAYPAKGAKRAPERAAVAEAEKAGRLLVLVPVLDQGEYLFRARNEHGLPLQVEPLLAPIPAAVPDVP